MIVLSNRAFTREVLARVEFKGAEYAHSARVWFHSQHESGVDGPHIIDARDAMIVAKVLGFPWTGPSEPPPVQGLLVVRDAAEAATTTVSTRFAAWLASTGWRSAEAAYRLGCDASYLGRLRKGDRRPGLRIALTIEQLSAAWAEGPIAVQEWHDASSIGGAQ